MRDVIGIMIILLTCGMIIVGYTFFMDLQKNMQVPEYERPFPAFTLSPDNYNYPGNQRNQ